MDLNYLYARHQVELMRADAAGCSSSGDAHRELASLFLAQVHARKQAATIGLCCPAPAEPTG